MPTFLKAPWEAYRWSLERAKASQAGLGPRLTWGWTDTDEVLCCKMNQFMVVSFLIEKP